jgi:hypothetical protein
MPLPRGAEGETAKALCWRARRGKNRLCVANIATVITMLQVQERSAEECSNPDSGERGVPSDAADALRGENRQCVGNLREHPSHLLPANTMLKFKKEGRRAGTSSFAPHPNPNCRIILTLT